MRKLILTFVALFCVMSTARAEQPITKEDAGIIEAKVYGKLVRKEWRYYIQARNPGFPDIYLVWLSRSEDKNRDLDAYLVAHEGKVIGVEGPVAYHPRRSDGGPEIEIAISKTSQFCKE